MLSRSTKEQNKLLLWKTIVCHAPLTLAENFIFPVVRCTRVELFRGKRAHRGRGQNGTWYT